MNTLGGQLAPRLTLACSALLWALAAPQVGAAEQGPTSAAGADIATAQIKAGRKTFTAELAVTRAQQRVGLMHRASLPPRRGLLMVLGQPRVISIWMKNVLIPLDVVWLDADGGIVDVRTLPICAAPPCPSFHPGKPASYVLEVNAGEFPLSRGGKVEIILPDMPGKGMATDGDAGEGEDAGAAGQ